MFFYFLFQIMMRFAQLACKTVCWILHEAYGGHHMAQVKHLFAV